MKPTIKQLSAVKHDMAKKRRLLKLTNAEISRISGVHQSQVGRICAGQFKTYSFNVVQICRVLDVPLPRASIAVADEDPSWAKVQSSIRDLWDETPEGAHTIVQMIEAVAKITSNRSEKVNSD